MKRVHVVAGVVLDPKRENVLLAKRRTEQHQGGLWEYPGGKCESGERDTDALVRELAEEIGIQATAMTPLLVVEHDYPDKSVKLAFFVVTAFSGEAVGCEGQAISWVPVAALDRYAFPEANRAVSAALEDWLQRSSARD